jgi:hypothetical protein
MNLVPPRPTDLDALIAAHPFITIERPPELWQPDANDVRFIRFFGELLALLLARNGGELAAVTVNISNMVVEASAAGPMPDGEFVAITGFGAGDWSPEIARCPAPQSRPALGTEDLEAAAAAAGAAWAYTRQLSGDRGSVTVLFRRRDAASTRFSTLP